MTDLAHPPIRQTTVVRSDVAHTFDVFVRRIGEWWPTRPHSLGQEKVVGVTVEEFVSGRVFETWADGKEVEWGRVTGWEPPARFAMTWEITPVATEVELRFRALGPALTRVELEHSGWERLSEEQYRTLTAVEGGYPSGWTRVLDLFREAAEQ